MEKKEEVTYNNDGTYVKKGEINTYPSDGFVPMSDLYPHDADQGGRYGYGIKHYYAETNDQRIIIPSLLIFISFFGLSTFLIIKETYGIVISIVSLIVLIGSIIYLVRYLKKRKKNNNQ